MADADNIEPPIQYDPVPTVETGFATTHPPAPNYGPDTGTGDASEPLKGLIPTGKDRFPANEQWLDVPWAIAYLLHSAVFYGLLIWQAASGCTKALEDLFDNNENNDFQLKAGDVVIFMTMAMIIGSIVSFMILLISRKYAKQLMWVGLGLQAVISVALIVWGVVAKVFALSIVGAVMLVLIIIMGFLFRNNIGLAAALLTGAGVAVRKNWGMIVLTLAYAVYVIIALASLIIWLCAIAYLLDQSRFPDEYNPGLGYTLAIWGLLAYIWIDYTVLNMLHMTCCGSCARLFYLGERQQPQNPTVTSAKLATTKHFGAACLGGFLTACVTWLRIMVETAKGQAASEGNLAGYLLACCCAFFLSCIEAFVKIVNQYAMVYVAMYGNGFWKSGKMVLKLMVSSGLEPIFQDWSLSLYNTTVVFFSALLSVALLGGLSAALFKNMSLFHLFSSDAGTIPIELIIMYAVAAIMCGILTAGVVQPLDSGARTLLVLFMEAPAYFYQSQPEVYLAVRDRALRMGLVKTAPAHFIYT